MYRGSVYTHTLNFSNKKGTAVYLYVEVPVGSYGRDTRGLDLRFCNLEIVRDSRPIHVRSTLE